MPEHTREPDHAVVHRILTAYTNADGTPGPAHADALAGLVHATVGWFAFNLWRCLGHRPVTPQQQRHATQVVIEGLTWVALLHLDAPRTSQPRTRADPRQSGILKRHVG
jgi:hypothetical protein